MLDETLQHNLFITLYSSSTAVEVFPVHQHPILRTGLLSLDQLDHVPNHK